MILSISYDLTNPNRDYDSVIETIKTSTYWAHPLKSLWLVDTQESTSAWLDKLAGAGDKDDKFFVNRITKDWTGYNLPQKVVDWLDKDSRTW